MPPVPDPYNGAETSILAASKNWAALTPHDVNDFPFLPKAIAVGETPGTFVAVSEDNTTATFYGNAGQIIPIRPKRINAAALTAGMTFVGLK